MIYKTMLYLIASLLITTTYCFSQSDFAKTMQWEINSIKEFQKPLRPPLKMDEYRRIKKEFNPNMYFKYFKNLKLKEGKELNFILSRDRLGSYPVIIDCNQSESKFVESLLELTNDTPKDIAKKKFDTLEKLTEPICTKNKDYPELPMSVYSHRCTGYLKSIIPDSSKEGYFEYIALSIIGNQFCLDWHANYNDYRIVCTKQELEKIIDEERLSREKGMIDKLNNIDLEPVVEFVDEEVKIRLVIFTNWGGFFERTYIIDKSNNNEMKDFKDKNIVEYDCGIMF